MRISGGTSFKTGRLVLTIVLVAVLAAGLVMPGAASAAPEQGRYLVGFTHQPGRPEHTLIAGLGGEIIHSYRIVPALAVRLPDAAAAALAGNPRVTYVETDKIAYAIGETLPWGVDRIDADVVHSGGNSGSGIKVAIIDTGIDLDHPDLTVAGGATFVEGTTSPDDDEGHGTHVAGTVAALAGNGIGVIGVAPAASLYAVKVLDSSGSGYYSDIVAGIDWSVSNGMQVINMSLGGSSDDSTLRAACDNAYAAGVVVVAAAGNSGNPAGKGDNVGYPAKYESVIAVAATDSGDRRASFSSTGPAVELAAPGVDILSTYYGGQYATASGTSMASPHVAGVATLVLYANPGFTNVEVRSAMTSTAIDLGAAGRDTLYGYGLVYAPDAAGSGGGGGGGGETGVLGATVSTDKSVYVMGETVTITVTVTDANGVAMGDAAVHLDILTAAGKAWTADGTTSADGRAVFSYKTKVPDGRGVYTVTATASKSGYTGAEASTTFEVQ